jgi:hypothetical protein
MVRLSKMRISNKKKIPWAQMARLALFGPVVAIGSLPVGNYS